MIDYQVEENGIYAIQCVQKLAPYLAIAVRLTKQTFLMKVFVNYTCAFSPVAVASLCRSALPMFIYK